jgi:outer membrane protein assembly factor BamB
VLIFSLFSCSKPKPKPEEDQASITPPSFNQPRNTIQTENQKPTQIGKLESSLALDILKETKKALNKSTLEGFNYNVIPDQDLLYITTNQGVMFIYDIETKKTIIITNTESKEHSPSSMFGNYLLENTYSDRYTAHCTYFDKETFKKLDDFSYSHHTQDLFGNNDHLYRHGTVNQMGENIFAAYDKNLKLVWNYPKSEDSFIFLHAFEINHNFHIICTVFDSNTKMEYLYNIVIQADTGKELLKQPLIQDKNQFCNTIPPYNDQFYYKVFSEGNDLYIESIDEKGVYIAKLRLNGDLSFLLLWKNYITDNKKKEDVISPYFHPEIFHANLSNQSLILIPLEKKNKSLDVFDIYCIEKISGKVKWISNSLNGSPKIYGINSTILVDANSNTIESNNHCFYSLDPESGSIKWKKILQDKYDSEINKYDLTVSFNNSAFFVFSQVNQTLSRFDAVDGKESIHQFNLEKPLFGRFASCNDQTYLILDDKFEDNRTNITLSQLYEVGE